MAKFKVGDKVRRITCPNLDFGGRTLEVGSVHTIAGVSRPAGWGGTLGLLFEGFTGPSKPEFFELVEAAPEPAPAQHVSSRSNDPTTSKGKRKVNKYEQAITQYLCVGAAATGKEIAADTGHPLNCITPRFAPLRRKGLIKDSGQRRDKQIVWVLA